MWVEAHSSTWRNGYVRLGLRTGHKVKGNFQDKLQFLPLCAFSSIKANCFCARHCIMPWLEVSKVKMWWHGRHTSILQVLNMNLGSCPTLYPVLLAYNQGCICLHTLQLHLTLQIWPVSVTWIVQGVSHQFMKVHKQRPELLPGVQSWVEYHCQHHLVQRIHTHHAAFLPCIYIIYIYITDHTQAQTRENPQCLGVRQDCAHSTGVFISTLGAKEFSSRDGANQGHGSE